MSDQAGSKGIREMSAEELLHEFDCQEGLRYNEARAELLRRLALVSQPEPRPIPQCPKCGELVSFDLLSKSVSGIVALCCKGHRFPLYDGLKDCAEFFAPCVGERGSR